MTVRPQTDLTQTTVRDGVCDGKGVPLSGSSALVLAVDEVLHRDRIGDGRHGGDQRDQRDQRVSAGLDDERSVGVGELAQHERCALQARQRECGGHRLILALARCSMAVPLTEPHPASFGGLGLHQARSPLCVTTNK